MRAECVQEIAAAIGRTPSLKEVDFIEGDILAKMRDMARSEPEWRSMTGAERVTLAAESVHADALAHADKVAERRANNLLAQTREAGRLAERAKTIGGKTAHHTALFERMRQIDDYVSGVRNESLSELIDAVSAVEPKFFGWLQDPESVKRFARAVMEGKADTPEMAKAAKAYTDAMERMRVRGNAAGADIGKLDYGYLPQPHDTGRIARAGRDKWISDIQPKLDPSRYLAADGTPMSDVDMRAMLETVYDTISTEGLSKRVAGQGGGGSRASRFDDKHRALHFKDADAYMQYIGDYGRGSMMSAIHGHVGMMAKTIGMMEEFGSNPNATYKLLKDTAEIGDGKIGVHESFTTLDMVWDTLNGTTAQPVSQSLARFFQGVRYFTTAAKLQGVMLSAITDAPLQVIVARSAGVPLGGAMKSLIAGVGKGRKALANEMAVGMDEIAGEMARWHQDNLAQGWTAKLAQATMRLTLVEAWTNALRRGYALILSGTLDRMRQTHWDALHAGDRNRLEASGITGDDWKIWQLAEAQNHGDLSMLTKNGIRNIPADKLQAAGVSDLDVNRATSRLLGYLDQEARTAVLSPDIQTRAMIQQGTKSGTWGGEFLRSLMLFKSFSFGIVEKHLRRIKNIPTTQGKVAYSAAMMTSLTLFGAVTLQLKDLVQGKDPRDMTTSKFWLTAFMQGGGIGIFGDVLYTGMGGNARGGQANWTSLAGPVFGTAMDAADLTIGNAYRYATAGTDHKRGKVKAKVANDALRFARGNTPLLNLWYLRGAIDHMVLHDLQEQLSPGYLRKMRQRSQKDWDQDYYWQPGDPLPDRAPNLEAAVGER